MLVVLVHLIVMSLIFRLSLFCLLPLVLPSAKYGPVGQCPRWPGQATQMSLLLAFLAHLQKPPSSAVVGIAERVHGTFICSVVLSKSWGGCSSFFSLVFQTIGCLAWRANDHDDVDGDALPNAATTATRIAAHDTGQPPPPLRG